MTDDALAPFAPQSWPYLWQKQTRRHIGERSGHDTVLIQPIGSTEQHGDHLPLDTDAWVATSVAVAAARQASTDVLVLPTIWWGLSDYWMPYPGTISLRLTTAVALLEDVCRSVAAHGFDRLVILNGHGGNTGLIRAVASDLAALAIRIATVSYWDLAGTSIQTVCKADNGHPDHSGEMETSLDLYLQPDAVDEAEIHAANTLNLDEYESRFGPPKPPAYLPPHPATDAPHGIYGSPQHGAAAKGARIFHTAAANLAEFIDAFRRHG